MLLWLSIFIAGSFVVLSRLGDYGSIVQPLAGLVMGSLGAASHALLCLSARFRALGFLRRALLNWLCAYVPFIAIAAVLINFRMAEHNPDFWASVLRIMVLYTGCPMLVIAVLTAIFTSSRRLR
jgi:hypothetical protein